MALSYLLSMKPELEVQDEQGFTPLHLAVKNGAAGNSTRSVRALLLKGASRSTKDNSGNKAINVIDKNLSKELRSELKAMLKTPTYCECCMVKFPIVPLQKNIRTVLLFSFLCLYIYFNLFFVIYPGNPSF